MPPRLNKSQLLGVVEAAIRDGGWNYLHLTEPGTHPAQYQVYRGDSSYAVRVYIWNLTHGGRNRPDDEWRIQATGVSRFAREPGGKTLILGWRPDLGVFAGFDAGRHSERLGASPSIQLREAALKQAAVDGLAVSNKGSGELAIAFRPDLLAAYLDNLESLHECGRLPADFHVLTRIAHDPDGVDDDEVVQEIEDEHRRYAVLATKRALRDGGFRHRVLTAYGQRCAMCGIQLKLLDGAHILPAKHPQSTDRTHNGVALCALHHRSYDNALVTFDAGFETHLNDSMIDDLRTENLVGELERFKRELRPILWLPPDRRDRPLKRFVEMANSYRGWRL
ncbi:MAG: HNH endonuclease [Gammaproteobacteria bacterium]|nr:HNH endonuclease [Gammaproteobacteria bacterium]